MDQPINSVASRQYTDVPDGDDGREAHRKIKLELELDFFGNYDQAKKHVLSVAQQLRLFGGSSIRVLAYTIRKQSVQTHRVQEKCQHLESGQDDRGKVRCFSCGLELKNGAVE